MLQRPLGGKRLFDCDFPAAWKKIPKCVVCGVEFSTNHMHVIDKSAAFSGISKKICKFKNNGKKQELSYAPDRLKNSRRPLVLDCTHNVCEHCVFTNRSGNLCCKECQKSNPIDRSRPIRERFEFNYYLIGLINYIEYNLQKDLNHPCFTREIESYSKQNECSECNGNTNLICLQCNVPYCKNCFTNVHKLGRALQKHSLIVQEKKTILADRDYHGRCMVHKRYYDKYCSTCETLVCVICVTKTHDGHEVGSLSVENKKFIPKINSLIETVKLAKEYNRQAQKEIRLLEKSYEDYASDTIEQVTKFFTLMHSTFQIMEKNILTDIKKQTTAPLRDARNALNTFMKAYESLEEIKNNLQLVIDNPPNCLLSKIIERTNTKLEETACSIELEQIKDNPFSFIILKDAVKEAQRLVSLTSRTNPLRMKIMSFYGDKSGSEVSEQEKYLFHNSYGLPNLDKKDKRAKSSKSDSLLDQTVVLTQSLNLSEYSSLPSVVNTQKVHVSHIKSPSHFFVQNQMFLSTADDFKTSCGEEADYASIPDSIEVNEIYLVYNTTDKGWYRGKVIKAITNNTYRVFLIDYGNIIQVGQQRFREIGNLRSPPNGAIECCIYGVNPTNGSWTDEASQLMAELIKNHLVTLIVLKNKDPQNLVDLVTTHSKYPTSLRDALLYTNLAEFSGPVDIDIEDRLITAEEMKNNLIPIPSERFYKNVFKEHENFRVIIANIINPQEFYVVKYDHKETLDKMQRELNEEYEESKEKLFAPHQNMPCAVFVNSVWFRGRFVKALGNGNSKVWLVDEGRHESVNWTQIRVLDEKFLVSSEFAIQCSLVDIEPLQDNDYSWTEEAINEFKRIAKNPILQVFVHRSKNFRYKVVLSIIKKTVDVNVNALLVTYNHAIASGPEATNVEFHKEYSKNSSKINMDEITQIANMNAPIPKSPASAVEKTKIRISHIVSPGEFYVYLVDHINGISQLHREIQIEQQKKSQPLKFRNDWEIGEYCLVHVSLKQNMQKQWYRGIIKDSNYSEDVRSFSVFLCDHGHTLHGITILQLDEIDKSFSRVCNGAILCHLACVQPTGGLEEWSYSSKDEFKNITLSYEAFGATIQGKRMNNSIPIILWGMTTAYCDPFKPSICKWVNINKSLMNCGLAHMVEKFDLALQVDGTISNELQEGQETFEQWIEYFNQRLNEPNEPFDFLADKTNIDDDMTDEVCDGELKSWPPVRLITKTVFTAYPTYVDNEVNVYLHDAIDHSLLEAMKSTIDAKMKDTKPVENLYWYSGQPCLALYHLDNKFYRAVVIETKPNQIILVQFVDYGNIEECTTADLRPQIMMQHIPILANKYQIEGLVPKNQDDGWSIDTLDFIHSQLVGKLCTIRVSPNEEKKTIKKCSIKVENIDIAELLWSSGLAGKAETNKRTSSINENNPLRKSNFGKGALEQKKQEIVLTDSGSNEEIELKPPTPLNLVENNQMDPDDFKKLFEKKELESLYKSITIPSNDSDEDIIELEYSFQMGYWDDDKEKQDEEAPKEEVETPTSSMSFNPIETSSIKSHLKEGSVFKVPKLPKETTKFYCEVTYVQNSTHLYISPFLINFDTRFNDMSKQIQSIVKTCQSINHFEKDTPCLAKYAADQLWYRAVIRSYRSDIEKFDVLFVDFLNAELVTKDMVKMCPDHLIEYPLRNIVVKLSGLKPNPRLREADILRKLSDILCEYKKVFVKIKKFETIPEVEIFSTQNSTSVIYSEMIEQRYFLKD